MLKLKTHQMVISRKKTICHHASTVLPLRDDHVLVAWFGGSYEKCDDVGIYLAEKDTGGFSEPRLMASSNQPHWNPVLFQCHDGRIQLFYKVGREIPDWQTWLRESYDLGHTWSKPSELIPGDTSGGRGPVRNHPLVLKSGRIIAPASVERGLWRCFMDLSDDDGRTWRRSPMIEARGIASSEPLAHGRGIIQPALWEDDGGIHALMRSGEGKIYRSDSADEGETWTPAIPTSLPNNNSGIDVIRLDCGILLLVSNPVGESFGPRTPLTVSASPDGGITWETQCVLEAGPGEFSYPSIASAGNQIWITYTYRRENIAFWEFDWLD